AQYEKDLEILREDRKNYEVQNFLLGEVRVTFKGRTSLDSSISISGDSAVIGGIIGPVDLSPNAPRLNTDIKKRAGERTINVSQPRYGWIETAFLPNLFKRFLGMENLFAKIFKKE